MTRVKWLTVTAAATLVVLSLAGCPKKNQGATDTKPTSQSLAGSSDHSNMPPEARAKMEEAMKNAQKGPRRK